MQTKITNTQKSHTHKYPEEREQDATIGYKATFQR